VASDNKKFTLHNALFKRTFAFEVLVLRLQKHSNYHFRLESLVRGSSMRILTCSMRIGNIPGAIPNIVLRSLVKGIVSRDFLTSNNFS
jgi:hypothetical protein